MALTTIGLMALLGCFTGFMAGLLGIGGGMIITPFLIMLIPSSLFPMNISFMLPLQHRWQPSLLLLFLPSEHTINAVLFCGMSWLP